MISRCGSSRPSSTRLKPVAGGYGLDPAWVYGLIRQESRFIMDARSSAGAQGLMQMMPATAKWVARKLGVADFRVEQLHGLDTEPAVRQLLPAQRLRRHGRIGAPGLRRLQRGPQSTAQLARHAAGHGRGAVFAEIIPFNETRDYVKKVLSNATLYAALFTGRPQSLKERPRAGRPQGGDDLRTALSRAAGPPASIGRS
jgi:soluble lytic murein transglycosylase